MRVLRAIGKFFWRFMVIFSFIVNIILVIVLLAAGLLIFDIKNNVAQPLVTGLHSSFVGLDQATIDWTIPVRDVVPVNLDIPLQTNTVVTLTDAVPLTVQANIVAPGLTVSNATVTLSLPQGLQLPVALDLNVEVRDTLPVSLDVRAVIPLEETQLHDVATNLRLLFEPFGRGLHNLPSGWGEVPDFVSDVVSGDVNLLNENDYSRTPWTGFSRTAGLNYNLANEDIPLANIPLETGLVMQGGIPGLDEQIRPDVYDQGGPEAVNAQAIQSLSAFGISPSYYTSQSVTSTAPAENSQQEPPVNNNTEVVNPTPATTLPEATNDSTVTNENDAGGGAGSSPEATEDQGIVATPTGG
ncbi:MAG: hypothetical protein RLP44_30205 [Aggregatilineales bacterium]